MHGNFVSFEFLSISALRVLIRRFHRENILRQMQTLAGLACIKINLVTDQSSVQYTGN